MHWYVLRVAANRELSVKDKLELKVKMEEEIIKGHYSSILYSNPNNPSWICLNEDE